MNVFNVHSNRSPVDGRVDEVVYNAGSFLNAAVSKASTENERNAVLATLADGTKVTYVQIAGLVARRIVCHAKVGDQLARGQRYGFIRFGSRVDVYLPLTAQARVTIGDKVSATETILAELADASASPPRSSPRSQPAGGQPLKLSKLDCHAQFSADA